MLKYTLLRGFIFLLMMSIWPISTAFGAATRTTSLFFIHNIKSDLILDYEYERRSSEVGDRSTKSQRHLGEATYGVFFNYTFLERKYWQGSYEARFGGVQRAYDVEGESFNSSNDLIQEYRAEGILLKDSRASLSFDVESRLERFKRRIALDYDVDRSTYNVTLKVRSKTIPTSLVYYSNEYTTKGLEVNRWVQVKSLTLRLNHSYSDISSTSYETIASREESIHLESVSDEKISTDSLIYSLINRFEPPVWRNDALVLHTNYRFRDETGFRQGREWSWRERLDVRPGRALQGEFTFERDSQDWFDLTRDTDRAEVNLTHQLFNSLSVGVRSGKVETTYHNGFEEIPYSSGRVRYQKKLPYRRNLNISVELGTSRVDRDVDSNTITVHEERLILTADESYLLRNPNVVASSILVQSEDRQQVFQEGTDYLVSTIGEFTEIFIPINSDIRLSGSSVLVNYQYLINPSIEYKTDTFDLSVSLGIRNSAFIFYGRYHSSDPELISGDDEFISLERSFNYTLGVRGNTAPHSFNVEGQYLDRGTLQARGGHARYLYNKRVLGTRFFSTSQYVYRQTTRDDWTTRAHLLSTRLGMHKQFPKKIVLRLEGDYRFSYGEDVKRHEVETFLLSEFRIRKTLFQFRVEDLWIFSTKETRHTDVVGLKMIRHF